MSLTFVPSLRCLIRQNKLNIYFEMLSTAIFQLFGYKFYIVFIVTKLGEIYREKIFII